MESLFIIIFGFLSSLFILHVLSKDDYVLIRRSVSPEQIFDFGLILGVFSIFFARFSYAIINSKTSFLNPLVFLTFPYYPGFSLVGGVFGGTIFFLYFAAKKKLPLGKVFDIFSVITLFTFSISYFFANIFSFIFRKTYSFYDLCLFFIFLFLFIILFKLLLRTKLNDGLAGLFFIILFSIVFGLKNILVGGMDPKLILANIENFLLFLMFFSSIVVFIKERKNFFKMKN